VVWWCTFPSFPRRGAGEAGGVVWWCTFPSFPRRGAGEAGGVVLMRIHNLQLFKSRRRNLRHELTPAEARLWTYLQDGQLHGRKFRRQHSIGPYIVDFYCPSEKLVVELDGSAHDHHTAFLRDETRSCYLEGLGIRVLRIENHAVFEDPDAVLDLIAQCFAGA